MKPTKRFIKLFTILILLLARVVFNGCEKEAGLVSPNMAEINPPAGRFCHP